MFKREEALLLLLTRFHSPDRWEKLKAHQFGGSNGKLSEAYNMILRFLFENHAQRLLKGLEQHVPYFERWAEAIYNKS